MIDKWNEIIAKLHGVKKSGSGYIASCPVRSAHRHDDKEASLSLSLAEDRILVKCHTGCTFNEIVSALGMQPTDFFSQSESDEIPKRRVSGRIKYVYNDIKGNPLYCVERIDYVEGDRVGNKVAGRAGKTYRQFTMRDGEWVPGLDSDVPRVPYRLNEWSEKTNSIFIVEGEKAVDALRDIQITATTGIGGSANVKQWADIKKYVSNFKNVYILPDNDGAGWKYADELKRHTSGIILDVAYEYEKNTGKRLGIKGDIADIIESVGKDKTREILRSAIDAEKEAEETPRDVSMSDSPEDLLNIIDWDSLDSVCPNIREICEVYAIHVQSEPHIILGALMTATAGIAQRFIRGIRVTRNYTEAFALFSLFVADSGRNKSGVVRLFGKPMDDICKQYNEKLIDQKTEWDAQYAMAKMKRKNIEKEAEKAVEPFWVERSKDELVEVMREITDLENKSPKPLNSIMTQDTTIEALVKALYFDKTSTGIVWSHEIKKLFSIILGEYKKTSGQADDTSLLTAYDNDTIRVSRKGMARMDEPNEMIEIYNPSLTIFGGIQTAVFDKMRKKGSMTDSGFLGRFMFWIDSNPDPVKIMLDNDREDERYDRLDGFADMYMKNLFEIGEERYEKWKQTGNADEALRQTLSISEEAKKYIASMYNERLYDERKRGGDLWSENGWFGKMHGMHIRIAAVLYVMRCAMTSENIMEGKIGMQEIKAAESITLYESAIARLMLESNDFDPNSPERVEMRIKEKVKECIKFMADYPEVFGNGMPTNIDQIEPLKSINIKKNPTFKDDVLASMRHARFILPWKEGQAPNMIQFNRKGYENALARKKERQTL